MKREHLFFVLAAYAFQIVVVILEFLYYGVWRYNVLYFTWKSDDDLAMSLVGLLYFGIYVFLIKLSKKEL